MIHKFASEKQRCSKLRTNAQILRVPCSKSVGNLMLHRAKKATWTILLVLFFPTCSELAPTDAPTLSEDSTGNTILTFSLDAQQVQLQLQPSSLLSQNLQVTRIRADETVTSPPKGRYFQGTAMGIPGSWARIYIAQQSISGMFSLGDDLYTVEGQLGDTLSVETIRTPTDPEPHIRCGVDHSMGATVLHSIQRLQAPSPSPEIDTFNPPLLRLVLVADYEYFQNIGTSAASNMLNILNQVDGIYRNAVHTGFVVTDVVVFETPDDPFDATGAELMLSELRDYRNAHHPNAGSVHLFTNRAMGGRILGIAFVGSLCSPFSVGISAGNSTTLVAHEIGHNFGALHDGEAGCGSGFIMNAFVNLSKTFSSCSTEAIDTFIRNNTTCFLPAPAVILPPPQTRLPSGPVTFSWTSNEQPITNWQLLVGSTLSDNDIYDSGPLGSATTTTVRGLPRDGRDVFVRLQYQLNGFWKFGDFVYSAFQERIAPVTIEIQRGRVCSENAVLEEGSGAAELAYNTADGFETIDGQNVTACIRADFREVTHIDSLRVVAQGVPAACGAQCEEERCGTGNEFKTFRSVTGEDFQFVQRTRISEQTSSYQIPIESELRYVLLCRSRMGSSRNHLTLDYLEAIVDTCDAPLDACQTMAPPYTPIAVVPRRGRVCDEAAALSPGGSAVGLGYRTSDGFETIDRRNVTSCLQVDFGATVPVDTLHVVARAVNATCGSSCTGAFCDTGRIFKTFTSADGSAFQYIAQTAITGQFDTYEVSVKQNLRYALICRGRTGSARDHLHIDYVEAIPLPLP